MAKFDEIEQVTSDEFAANTPRFINDDDFIYFQRAPWGPHADYHDLITCENGQHKVLVHADQKISLVEDEDIFPGIFLVGDNILIHASRLYLTTLWRNHHAIVEVNLDNGETRPLCFDDSVSRKSSKSKNKFEA